MERFEHIGAKQHNSMYRLSVDLNISNCPWCPNFKKVYSESELSPQGLCLLAFHAIYPYYLTLTNGGWFRWVKPKDGVIVQCPNPKGALEMKVFLNNSDNTVRIEILQARGNCPKGHKKGDVFVLRPDTFKFCPKALGAFIPYLYLLEKGGKLPWIDKNGRPNLICPHVDCGNAKFTVEEG